MLRLTLVLVFAWAVGDKAMAQEPWAVITGKSIMEVRGGLRHIYQRLGRKDLVAALDSAAVTNLLTGNLKGLDINRPVGCVVLPNKQGLGVVLTFVPATDPDKFRGFLSKHLMPVQRTPEGKEQITVPLFGSIALRFDQGYVWFAFQQSDLEQPLPNVKTLLPQVHHETLLAASIYLERMPVDQRQLLQARLQQGMQLLLGSGQKGELTETLGLPMAGLLLNRLGEDARQLTFLAHADTRRDELWAKVVLVPRENVRWLQAVQQMPTQKVELPASLWGKLRGKSEEEQNRAREKAFARGEEEKLILTKTRGETLDFKAEMKGSMLVYHAALDQKEETRKPRRERRKR
jgi:hypothetical protein